MEVDLAGMCLDYVPTPRALPEIIWITRMKLFAGNASGNRKTCPFRHIVYALYGANAPAKPQVFNGGPPCNGSVSEYHANTKHGAFELVLNEDVRKQTDARDSLQWLGKGWPEGEMPFLDLSY
jgi:hypothetical protein